jgi:hypothetical protein
VAGSASSIKVASPLPAQDIVTVIRAVLNAQ